jgi:two-component system, NarL family, sensor kinase
MLLILADVDASPALPSGPGPGMLGLVLALLLVVFSLLIFALRAWFRRSMGIADGEDRIPSPEERDLISLVHVAKYAGETTAALEVERAARRSTEDALSRSQSLLERTLAERLRLGRELHDDTCQVLYGTTLHLDALRSLLHQRAPDLEPGLLKSLEQLRALNRRVRTYIDQLEASPLPAASWQTLLAEGCAPFSGLPGLTLSQDVSATLAAGSLAPAFAEDLVAIVREAHANALRHGRASEIRSEIRRTEQGVRMTIRDNGSGFDPAAAGQGHGLGNLRSRADRMRGTFRIESTPGNGATVTLEWPVAPQPTSD